MKEFLFRILGINKMLSGSSYFHAEGWDRLKNHKIGMFHDLDISV